MRKTDDKRMISLEISRTPVARGARRGGKRPVRGGGGGGTGEAPSERGISFFRLKIYKW